VVFWRLMANHRSGGFMTQYRYNYAIDSGIDTRPALDRNFLEIYTGGRISEHEAKKLLRRIADHKWYLSERLDRDVGFHVAAIDYVENFYQPRTALRAGSKIAEFSQKATRVAG